MLPRYGGASLVEVPAMVLSHFGIGNGRPVLQNSSYLKHTTGAEKIILFFADGLGYNHLVRARNAGNRLFELFRIFGSISALTTIFPTTTAAGLTSVHSGLSPQEHGLPEWNVYFKEFDMVIQTIPFTPYHGKERDQLLAMGGTPEMLYDGPTIYEELRRVGVPSYVFANKGYAESTFSRATFRGSSVVPFTRGFDLMVKLRVLVEADSGPGYFFVYWDPIDIAEHEFGPESAEHYSETNMFSTLIVEEFLRKCRMSREAAAKVSLLLTADHGQIAVRPENIVYLDDLVPLGEYCVKGGNGAKIMPTGSARDTFLFVNPQRRMECVAHLRTVLDGVAEVLLTEDAIACGLFGIGTPCQRFLDRIGNVLILPRGENLIWHREYRKDPTRLRGTHGGLSLEELLIPFCAARLSDLLD